MTGLALLLLGPTCRVADGSMAAVWSLDRHGEHDSGNPSTEVTLTFRAKDEEKEEEEEGARTNL